MRCVLGARFFFFETAGDSPNEGRAHETARQNTPPKNQFPNAASDPQGAHGRRLQTLEDAYRSQILEEAVDAALADARAKNNHRGGGKSSGDGGSK